MLEAIMAILTLGIQPWYKNQLSFFKLISEFRTKLPRPQNQARNIDTREIEKNPILPQSLKYVTAVDLSTLKPSLTEQDLDAFYNSLFHFNFSWFLFKKYYIEHRDNILRLMSEVSQNSLNLVVLHKVLQDDPFHPLKPFDVLVHHFKYKYKFTSRIYLKSKLKN